MALAAAVLALAGCGGRAITAHPANPVFSVSPGTADIDTNCVGCNAANSRGGAVERFAATLNGGGAARVVWSLSGGDPNAGPGTITASGEYSPPTFLTADRAIVAVTAALRSDPSVQATAVLTLAPGFQQPLTPENAALGPGGSVTLTGTLAEAGGGAGVHFALSDTPNGSSGGAGTLGAESCQRNARAFTACSVTYTAPSAISANTVTYVVAIAGNASARAEAAILLNATGIASNPAAHQAQMPAPMLLGGSGGNSSDYDARGETIVDCCSGTLGALLADAAGRQYILSNNHVLARSDHASAGDAVLQPGLIDNNCTAAGAAQVGSLTGWLPLSAAATNADAAIAEVASHSVDPAGRILELGARQPDGTLAAAPPGISSSGGKGEAARLDQRVAKSGRTTGLTCGGVTAVAVDIAVDYFRDCAETRPYLTKTFTNQIGLAGNNFSDSGDSGALVVDAANAEPVGLYFAGGRDTAGVGQGMANPVGDVLGELSAQLGSGLAFVGGADHPVSCLSYGDSTIAGAQARPLARAEIARVRRGLVVAQRLVNPTAGVLGAALGKSSDRPGEAAIVIYLTARATAQVPPLIAGLRTIPIVTNARAVALGVAPTTNMSAAPLTLSVLNQALEIKRQVARGLLSRGLLARNPAFFGVGVGQSLDNPREAALVIYVDRKRAPSALPPTIGGLRTRAIVMDRLHVTRSFATTATTTAPRSCAPRAAASAFSLAPGNPAGRL
ncbi:MAG TPA: hypothetical protein VE291_14085 [Terracidiphilus sp.]|nr:hypothetical protein [Terracidiphilus sp.]